MCPSANAMPFAAATTQHSITTLMLGDVPGAYTYEMFTKDLASRVDFAAIDFVYLPWLSAEKRNDGYVLVNFSSAALARSAAESLHGQPWTFAPPDYKPVRVAAASEQGIASNLRHYTKTAVTSQDARTWGPRVFLDGKRASLAAAIALHCAAPKARATRRGAAGASRKPGGFARKGTVCSEISLTSSSTSVGDSSVDDCRDASDGASSSGCSGGLQSPQFSVSLSTEEAVSSSHRTSHSYQPEKQASQWSVSKDSLDDMFYDVDLRQGIEALPGANVPTPAFMASQLGLVGPPGLSLSF